MVKPRKESKVAEYHPSANDQCEKSLCLYSILLLATPQAVMISAAFSPYDDGTTFGLAYLGVYFLRCCWASGILTKSAPVARPTNMAI